MISSSAYYYFCAAGQCVEELLTKSMRSKVCWTINFPQKVPVIIIWEEESVHVFIGDADLGCQGSLLNFSVCLVVNISIHMFIVLTLPVLLLYWRMWNLCVKKDGLLAFLSTMMKGLFLVFLVEVVTCKLQIGWKANFKLVQQRCIAPLPALVFV